MAEAEFTRRVLAEQGRNFNSKQFEISFASGKAEFISWILRAQTGALG
jgi:hypothetical protein